MISKQYIKSLEFKTIDDVYSYVIDSYINGAISQCKELINKMSNDQFKEFINTSLNEMLEENNILNNDIKIFCINARGDIKK